MDSTTVLILLTLFFAFYMAWNIGANDVSNAMGTSVGSGALKMWQAVALAAILEFCGAFFFGSYVSETMQTGIINPEYFASEPLTLVYGMISALIAAGVWLQIATFFGWPVSTTHAIVGALIGFGAVVGGAEAIHWSHIGLISFSWVLSPLGGGVMAFLIFTWVRNLIFHAEHPLEAAIRLTPWLTFFTVAVLTGIVLCKGLRGVEMAPHEVIFWCLIAGGLMALTCRAYAHRIRPNRSLHTTAPPIDPRLKVSLEKARQHLMKALDVSSDEFLRDRLDWMIEEIEQVNGPVVQRPESETAREFEVVERIFGYLQVITACFMAFVHGANDVANAVGPAAAAIDILFTGNVSSSGILPYWMLLLGGGGIVIGLATWGWRVMYTIGHKITSLTPSRGFSAEFGTATAVAIASALGMPISTTHTLVGAVLGVGLARGIGSINLIVLKDIVISWFVTIPAGAGIAVCCFYLVQTLFG